MSLPLLSSVYTSTRSLLCLFLCICSRQLLLVIMPIPSLFASPYASRRPSRQSSRQVSRRTSRHTSPSSPSRQRLSVSTAGLATSIKQLGQKPKPAIEIKLTDDQQDAFVPSYTSGDEIKGEVSITAQSEMRFNELYITFEGFAKTYVEKVATTSPTNGRTEAFALFLRLTNPNDPSLLPEPRVLEAKRTFTFPFVFVVPKELLPQSCPHPKNDTFPDGGHLGLPPSMGDPLVAGTGQQCLDDMAPDMSCISYSVKCRLTGPRAASGRHTVLAENTRKLRIVPAVPEAPPLDVRGGEFDDYRLQVQKSIKRGFLRKKLGHISMESAQPKSLRLPPLRSDGEHNVSTTATVNVRFDPRDHNAQPPRLQSMSTKLKIATFYSSQPLRDIPSKENEFHFSNVKGIFANSINLAHRCVENTDWKKHETKTGRVAPRHRDSGYSFSGTDIPQPSEGYDPKLPYYTARVLVPVSLPKDNKVFLPTFHSCLISRVYTLHLYLSFLTPQTSVKDPTLHLKLPLQISVEGKENIQLTMTPQEAAAIASQRANEFFNPRSIAPPNPELTHSSTITGSRTPRMGFNTPIRTSIDEESATFSSPRSATNDSATIAEDVQGEVRASQPSAPASAMDYAPQIASNEEIPPTPGPGWSHRPSVIPDPAQLRVYTMRPGAPQQRFQSLSFEDEEAEAMRTLADESRVPPPDYEGIAGMYRGYRPRTNTNVPPTVRQSGVQRVDARRWRDLTGSRP